MSAVLQCRNLVYRASDSFRLQIDELAIPRGSVYAVEGPNGSGKTTLLWLLCGLLQPDSGSVTVFDSALPPGRPDARRRMTLVMEDPYLLWGSVLRNVEYGLARRGIARRERRRRAEEALQWVRMTRHAGRSAWHLSQGERKRVALARALALETDILLLDEPTSFVDRSTAILIEELIEGLRGETTVVLSTHDVEQSRRLADDVVTLIDGRLSPVSHENVLDAEAISRHGARVARLAPDWEVSIGPGPEGPVSLLVDPAQILLCADAGAGHALAIAGMNIERHTVRICLEGSPRLLARRPREEISSLGLALGKRVLVEIPPAAVQVLVEAP